MFRFTKKNDGESHDPEDEALLNDRSESDGPDETDASPN